MSIGLFKFVIDAVLDHHRASAKPPVAFPIFCKVDKVTRPLRKDIKAVSGNSRNEGVQVAYSECASEDSTLLSRERDDLHNEKFIGLPRCLQIRAGRRSVFTFEDWVKKRAASGIAGRFLHRLLPSGKKSFDCGAILASFPITNATRDKDSCPFQ